MGAFSPVADGAMGLVVKQDSSEIFEPIRKRVVLVLPLLMLLAAFGVYFINRYVQPMARTLSESDRASRRARDELKSVMTSISDGLVISDQAGTLQFANEAAERVFGYGRGELIGRDLRELIPPAYREAHEAGMRRFIAQGTRRVIGRGSVELSGLRQDGTEFPLELTVDSINVDGQHSFVGVVRDVTARQEAQRALQTEKERLRVTLHSIGDAVLTTDVRGVVTYINPVAEGLIGVTQDAVVGRPVQDVLHLVDEITGEDVHNPVRAVLETGEMSGMAAGTVLARRDGRRIAIETRPPRSRGLTVSWWASCWYSTM